jgi:integrase
MMRPEALLRMLAAARREAEAGSPRNLALLSFMADTGVRVGEAVSVRLADLDLERGTAVVRGKTDTREVDFTPDCGDAIRAWLKVRPGGSPFLFVGLGNRSRGKQMTTNAVRIVFTKLAEAGEAEGPTNPHALRHLVGQTWVDEANARLAQAKLGHSQLQTTLQYYYRADRERITQETQRLSFLSGAVL